MLSTRTMTYECGKHKNNDKMMMLSTRIMQMSLLSTRTMTNDVVKHKNNANEAAK